MAETAGPVPGSLLQKSNYQTNYISSVRKLTASDETKVTHLQTIQREELKWRAGAAGFWAIMTVPVVVLIFEFLSNATILHPFAWIQGTCSSIFTWQFVLTVLALQVLSVPVMVFYYKCTRVYPIPEKSQLHHLMFILHPRQLLWILINAVLGILYTSALLNLRGEHYTNGYTSSDGSLKFILFFGIMLGVRYGVCFYTQKKYLITFPIIQERRFVRFRASLFPCLKSAFVDSLLTLRICLALYVVFWISGCALDLLLSFNYQTFSLVSSASTIMNLYLLWICVTLGTSVLLALNLTESLYKIFTTKAYTFLLESDFIGDDRILLKDALVSKYDILKHLAFMNLCDLSKYDGKRRKQIFAITQPGGHPETWNLVFAQCLSILEHSKQKFTDANLLEMHRGKPKKTADSFSPDQSSNKGNLASPAVGTFSSPLFSPNKSQNTSTREFMSPTFRPASQSLFSPQKTWTSTEEVGALKKQHSEIGSWRQEERSVFSNKLLSSFGFFSESQLKDQDLFEDQQLITWVLEGLSFIVAASFHEDTFGVVQRTLPEILCSLLSYLEAIERYIQTTVTDDRLQINKVRKFQKSKETNIKAQSYRIAVQSAIYNITTKFGRKLESVRIPYDYKKRLNAFIEYKD